MTTIMRKSVAALLALLMVFSFAVMIAPAALAEGTEEEVITDDVDEPIDEPVDEPIDEPVDEPIDEPAEEPAPAPRTGDATANLAIAIAATAIVAAAGMAFVLKKVR